MNKKQFIISLAVLLFITGAFILYMTLPVFDKDIPEITWVSPYKDINWNTVIRAKAQFHTHTTLSDGDLSPEELIDAYAKAGFNVLAITDHWKVTYPWENFNRSAISTGMLDIQGAEPSFRGPGQHHIISLYSNLTGKEMEFDQALNIINMIGGLASFAHPARSTERNNNKPSDYFNYLRKYHQIYGIDIFTRATFSEPERWPIGMKLYADILDYFGEASSTGWRPIWMTSTDDLHKIEDINQGFQIQLVDTLNKDHIYNSLLKGNFFWVANAAEADPPVITSIDFDKRSIKVKGSGFDKISWYFNNHVIHEGNTFNAVKNAGEDVYYVFFTACTSDFSIEKKTGSMIGSQPFWINRN